MNTTIIPLSPKQTFADNMLPAQLLLQVYQLLDSQDRILTDGEMVNALRSVINASRHEYLMVIYNDLFLGLVRERARVAPGALRMATLCHLLRQAVVASVTAYETYLPALLRANLPLMIRARGRDFVPRQDKVLKTFFAGITFDLDEALRLMTEENAPQIVAEKISGYVEYKYLSKDEGIHVTGALLGLANPWGEITVKLARNEVELRSMMKATFNRRNDIMHRADRPQSDPGGDAQEITYAWAKQAVDTIDHVCLALDELVHVRTVQLREMMDLPE